MITQYCLNGICKDLNEQEKIEHTSEYQYDTYGNLTYKTGVGEYIYDDEKINRLTDIEKENGQLLHFDYDANGNLLSDGVRHFKYKMNQLTRVSYEKDNYVEKDQTRFVYGPSGEKLVRVDRRFDSEKNKFIDKSTYYIGS